MAISFRYKTITRPDGSVIKTPSIPTSLSGKEKFETTALLDSGADLCAIPNDVGEILGLDLTGERTPAYGIGGMVDSVESRMNITVEKDHEHYTFQIPVKVILGDNDFPILLGRNGFFDKFVIIFDHSQEKVTLKKSSM